MQDLIDAFNPLVAFVSGLGGLILGVVGVLVAMRSNTISYLALKASKTLDSAELSIACFGARDCMDFIVGVPISANHIVEIPMPITVQNTGGRTADEVILHIRMNKDLMYGGFGKFKGPTGEPVPITTTGNFVSLLLSIGTLNPGVARENMFPLSLSDDTILSAEGVANARDGVPLQFKWEMLFSYGIYVTLSHRDNAPIGRKYSIRVFNTASETIVDVLTRLSDEARASFLKTPLIERIRRYINPRDSYSQRRISVIVLNDKAKPRIVFPRKGKAREPIFIDRYSLDDFDRYEGLEHEGGIFVPGLGVK